jgi:hypothetical protein
VVVMGPRRCTHRQQSPDLHRGGDRDGDRDHEGQWDAIVRHGVRRERERPQLARHEANALPEPPAVAQRRSNIIQTKECEMEGAGVK